MATADLQDRVEKLRDSLDTTTPEGRLVSAVLAVVFPEYNKN